MWKPTCTLYNTNTTDYWSYYPTNGDKINLTNICAKFTNKNRLVSTKEIFDKLNEFQIDGLEFYNSELDDEINDVLQKKIINKMKYIKLFSVKGNLFNYISPKLEKLILFNVKITIEFNEYLHFNKLRYLNVSDCVDELYKPINDFYK